MNRAKKILKAVLVVFGAMLVGAFVMNNLAPSPLTAAKAHCVEHGWEEHELSSYEVETSAQISRSLGTARFNVKRQDQTTIIRVELRKALYATEWQVVDYEETESHNDPSDAMP